MFTFLEFCLHFFVYFSGSATGRRASDGDAYLHPKYGGFSLLRWCIRLVFFYKLKKIFGKIVVMHWTSQQFKKTRVQTSLNLHSFSPCIQFTLCNHNLGICTYLGNFTVIWVSLVSIWFEKKNHWVQYKGSNGKLEKIL